MKIKLIIFFGTILFCFLAKNAVTELLNAEEEGVKEFILNSPTGPTSLKDYKGKIVLMYFGFLSCPEACPTTFANVAHAFKKLKKKDLDQVVLLFISLDPERDNISDMKDYVEYFHGNIVPLHGDINYVKRVAKFYHAQFRKIDLGEGMGYTIDHTLNLLVLNRSGEVIKNLGQNHNSISILRGIEDAIKEFP